MAYRDNSAHLLYNLPTLPKLVRHVFSLMHGGSGVAAYRRYHTMREPLRSLALMKRKGKYQHSNQPINSSALITLKIYKRAK